MLSVVRLDPDVTLPRRMTEEAVGLDLFATSDFRVGKGKILNIGTGVAIQIPAGHVGRIHGRSSLERRGLHCLAGVIDPDYTGEIQVVFKNLGAADILVARGERMCQLVIYPVACPEVQEVRALPRTERGAGGFGSTGK